MAGRLLSLSTLLWPENVHAVISACTVLMVAMVHAQGLLNVHSEIVCSR